VKALPFLAQGTSTVFTPHSEHLIRGRGGIEMGFELEEVQMPPFPYVTVISSEAFPAFGTGKGRALDKSKVDVQAASFEIETDVLDLPGRRNIQGIFKNAVLVAIFGIGRTHNIYLLNGGIVLFFAIILQKCHEGAFVALLQHPQ
jgi:hypothetical protein